MSHSVQTRTIREHVTLASILVILLLLVFVASWQLAPSVVEQRRDSGIFAYTGKVIREGGLPYVDAWDNKLPGVYYIDALAFVLFGTNRWALWLIENITIALAALTLYWLLKQTRRERLGVWTGPLLFVLFVRHPGLVSDVNFTEPYALLPQVVVFAAGYQFLREPRTRWAFVVGFAAGVALVIKQTTVGVALAFIPAIVISRHPVMGTSRRWKWLGGIVLGGLTCLGLVALFLLANGILDDALKASFVAASDFHTWVSAESEWLGETVLTTFTRTPFLLVFGPFVPFLVIGIRVAVRRGLAYPHANRQAATDATLALWAVITLVIDLLLSNVTNRGYAHYYITLIPAMVLLMTFSQPVLAGTVARGDRRSRRAAKWLRAYLVVLLVGVPLGTTLVRFYLANWDVTGPQRIDAVAQYVAEHTAPEDTVLVWGVDTAINFQANRDSPTQYSYGYPLIVPDEDSEQNVQEMLDDLAHRQPRMIVDTTMRDGLRIPPLDEGRRQQWWAEGGRRDVEPLEPIYRFVEAHCHITREIDRVAIYHCRYDLQIDSPLAPLLEPPGRGILAIWDHITQNYGDAVTATFEQGWDQAK